MRRICATCKFQARCQFFKPGREEWICGMYKPADDWQMSMSDLDEEET